MSEERGYFHPDIGYWQETAEVGFQFVRRPNGTRRVPLKPGPHHQLEYDEAEEKFVWVEQPAPEPAPPQLNPVQFEWLLAISGLDDVWDAIQNAAKASGDLDLYASLKAQRSMKGFLLSSTLEFKNNSRVQAIASQVAPDADISDETITALWYQAAEANFGTLAE